jgi:hypothetical protein
MKTLTQVQKYSKTLVQIATALVAVIAMTGCGKKSNNQNVVNPWGYGQPGCTTGCVGGPNGGGGLNVMSLGRNDSAGVYLQVQFIGQQQSQGGQANTYYGVAQAQGQITVQSGMYQSCGLPPGNYQVSGQVQWQGTSIFSGQLVVNSPYGQVPMPIQGSVNVSTNTGGMYSMIANSYPSAQQQCELRFY